MFIFHSGKGQSRLGSYPQVRHLEYTTSEFISAEEESDKGNTWALNCLGLEVSLVNSVHRSLSKLD